MAFSDLHSFLDAELGYASHNCIDQFGYGYHLGEGFGVIHTDGYARVLRHRRRLKEQGRYEAWSKRQAQRFLARYHADDDFRVRHLALCRRWRERVYADPATHEIHKAKHRTAYKARRNEILAMPEAQPYLAMSVGELHALLLGATGKTYKMQDKARLTRALLKSKGVL